MEITVIRRWQRKTYIIGEMYLDGKKFCHTLEPPKTAILHPCIPAGTYKVEMYPSGKFKAMRPILLDVPHRSGILIHEGNLPHNTQGCILVGKNTSVGSLSYSKTTLAELMYFIKKSKDTYITIKEDFQ